MVVSERILECGVEVVMFIVFAGGVIDESDCFYSYFEVVGD